MPRVVRNNISRFLVQVVDNYPYLQLAYLRSLNIGSISDVFAIVDVLAFIEASALAS